MGTVGGDRVRSARERWVRVGDRLRRQWRWWAPQAWARCIGRSRSFRLVAVWRLGTEALPWRGGDKPVEIGERGPRALATLPQASGRAGVCRSGVPVIEAGALSAEPRASGCRGAPSRVSSRGPKSGSPDESALLSQRRWLLPKCPRARVLYDACPSRGERRGSSSRGLCQHHVLGSRPCGGLPGPRPPSAVSPDARARLG